MYSICVVGIIPQLELFSSLLVLICLNVPVCLCLVHKTRRDNQHLCFLIAKVFKCFLSTHNNKYHIGKNKKKHPINKQLDLTNNSLGENKVNVVFYQFG